MVLRVVRGESGYEMRIRCQSIAKDQGTHTDCDAVEVDGWPIFDSHYGFVIGFIC